MTNLVDEGVLKKIGAKHCAQFYIVDADNVSTKQRLRTIINSAFDICKTV